MTAIIVGSEELDTEAEENERLRELMDLAGDSDVPGDERRRAIKKATEIFRQREPVKFAVSPDRPRALRWLSAWVTTMELTIGGKIPARRGIATLGILAHELQFELDDDERKGIGKVLEPFFEKLPLLQALNELRIAKAAGKRPN